MFDWSYIDAEGKTTGSSEQFDSQELAEAWVGAAWEDLVAKGVAEMSLRDLDAGTEVYRMGLGPA